MALCVRKLQTVLRQRWVEWAQTTSDLASVSAVHGLVAVTRYKAYVAVAVKGKVTVKYLAADDTPKLLRVALWQKLADELLKA